LRKEREKEKEALVLTIEMLKFDDNTRVLLETLCIPAWILDPQKKKMVWGNPKALKLLGKGSVEELHASDTKMSESTLIRVASYMKKIEQGESVTEQWTLYPNGKPVTMKLTCSGIVYDGNFCALVQANHMEQPVSNEVS